MGYLISFILGVVVATVGFSGISNMADKGVQQVQTVAKEAAKPVAPTSAPKQ
jgi:hypothetical protein